MRKPKQLLFNQEFKIKREFGGSLLKKSNAKKARPISTKEAMHIVLRSSKAKGSKSMLRAEYSKKIDKIIHSQAKHFHIKIYRYANVGNHIHLLVRASQRHLFKGFLRAISGLIARCVTGVERGRQTQSDAKVEMRFWDQRPFTRIVAWAKDFKAVASYVVQNFNEAMGFVPYKPRTFRQPDLHFLFS